MFFFHSFSLHVSFFCVMLNVLRIPLTLVFSYSRECIQYQELIVLYACCCRTSLLIYICLFWLLRPFWSFVVFEWNGFFVPSSVEHNNIEIDIGMCKHVYGAYLSLCVSRAWKWWRLLIIVISVLLKMFFIAQHSSSRFQKSILRSS